MEKTKIYLEFPDFSLIKESEEQKNLFYEKFSDYVKTFYDVIYEITKAKTGRRLIEPEIKKLIRRPSVRQQMLLKCGKEAFLLPDAKPYPKFPVMAPVVDKNGNVQKCEPHCGLVVAAYYRANEWMGKHPEYKKVAEKAEELYKKWHCENKVPIHISVNEVSEIYGAPVESFVVKIGESEKEFKTTKEIFEYLALEMELARF